VGFEPTIPASEGAKTVYALDRSTTVIGFIQLSGDEIHFCLRSSCHNTIAETETKIFSQEPVINQLVAMWEELSVVCKIAPELFFIVYDLPTR
jgi:hypothetical protein